MHRACMSTGKRSPRSGCAYAAALPVFLDDEIRLYYGASNGTHNGWRDGFLALATLRPDGFAGYQPADAAKPATVTTGVSAFLKMWISVTRRSLRPLE